MTIPRLRLVEPAFFELSGQTAILRSPLAATTIKLPIRHLPAFVEDPSSLSPADQDRLKEEGWLSTQKQPQANRVIHPWSSWGDIAWLFHSYTSKTAFISRKKPEQIAHWVDTLSRATVPEPTRIEKLKDSPCVTPMRREFDIPNATLARVLNDRRSHRDFTGSPANIHHLSLLLHYGFGPVRYTDSLEVGNLEMRAPLSGGSIHETSAIVIATSVVGLSSGVYVYDQRRHALARISENAISADLESMIYDQGFTEFSSFSIISISDAGKLSWKYRDARAYRILFMNAGCVAQVLGMVSEAIGLGMALTAAIDEDKVAQLFPIQAGREFPMFLFSFGDPQKRPDGLPINFRDPR